MRYGCEVLHNDYNYLISRIEHVFWIIYVCLNYLLIERPSRRGSFESHILDYSSTSLALDPDEGETLVVGLDRSNYVADRSRFQAPGCPRVDSSNLHGARDKAVLSSLTTD